MAGLGVHFTIADWASTLYPALRQFLLDSAKASERLRLVIDAHLTLSFAAGSVLNIKSGRTIEGAANYRQKNMGSRRYAV